MNKQGAAGKKKQAAVIVPQKHEIISRLESVKNNGGVIASYSIERKTEGLIARLS
jgi:hypothetical protein